jgi:hypothetical protein
LFREGRREMVHAMDVDTSNFKEKIKREILEGEVVKEEEIVGLVGEHLRFVEMIMEKGYEETHRMCSRGFNNKYKSI